ncbi:unnamed protein product [Adineta steineri]|uniref:MULE transposase domain-containing protein n=1 Tax=Adineta steineri TaxID=433720 RepID=A0A814H6P2_9BILA|nr:unnamed protein product [Adineta steineri]
MSNFEGCLQDILKTDFPNSQHTGCYFHYTQVIYRNIEVLGLSREYSADEEIQSVCRKIMALPLMPILLVMETYDDLHDLILASSTSNYHNRLNQRISKYHPNIWAFIQSIKTIHYNDGCETGDGEEMDDDDYNSKITDENIFNPTLKDSPARIQNTTLSQEQRKHVTSNRMAILSSPQSEKLDRVLKNSSICNNETAAYKIMLPINRRERRREQYQSS